MKAITNARIFTMTGKVIERGTVVWKDNKITGVTEEILPSSEDVFDAKGGTLIPGLINAHSQAGLKECLLGYVAGDDSNEISTPITPHIQSMHGVNPQDLVFDKMLNQGITTVAVAPGSVNVLGGSVSVLKTEGLTVDDKLLKDLVGIKASMGNDPKEYYRSKQVAPQTRMSIMAILRESLFITRDYLAAKNQADLANPLYNSIAESLIPVLQGSIPLFVHVNRLDDIHSALRLAKEFDLKLVLVNAAEAHLDAEKLASAGVKCIIAPGLKKQSRFELQEVNWQSPAILRKAGVEVAIVPDSKNLHPYELPSVATMLRKNGYELKDILEMLTIEPAKILNIENNVGSIEIGKDADLVLYKSEPFGIDEELVKIIINGKESLTEGGEYIATN